MAETGWATEEEEGRLQGHRETRSKLYCPSPASKHATRNGEDTECEEGKGERERERGGGREGESIVNNSFSPSLSQGCRVIARYKVS